MMSKLEARRAALAVKQVVWKTIEKEKKCNCRLG